MFCDIEKQHVKLIFYVLFMMHFLVNFSSPSKICIQMDTLNSIPDILKFLSSTMTDLPVSNTTSWNFITHDAKCCTADKKICIVFDPCMSSLNSINVNYIYSLFLFDKTARPYRIYSTKYDINDDIYLVKFNELNSYPDFIFIELIDNSSRLIYISVKTRNNCRHI
ncbi:hypothetical protein HZS_2090 [Henneguya salminicola]|nr:hypothetical protein HZS_2090 [Henneguya salminicola]